jgi:hypothetical protein
VDRLQAEVAAVVADAAETGEDAAATFGRVRDLAAGAPGRARPASRLLPDRPRPPRLTEPWFC